MLLRMRVSVGAVLGFEHRIDRVDRRTETGQHRFEHMITADAQLVADDLHLRVAVAEMPGEPRERGRVGGSDFDQRLRLAVDAHDRSVIEHETVSVLQADRYRQIEQKPRALHAGQHDAAAMALIGVEHDGIGRGRRVPVARFSYLGCSFQVASVDLAELSVTK